jgi:hypothetical protein
MTAETVSSSGAESPVEETNSCAPGAETELQTAGATTTAGSDGRTAQQLLWTIELHFDM